MSWRPTLNLAFAAALALIVALLAVLTAVLAANADEAMDHSAAAIAHTTASLVGERVDHHLHEAESAIRDVEAQVRTATFAADDPSAATAAVLATLLARPQLFDATWTWGGGPAAWQVSAIRGGNGDIHLRQVRACGEGFCAKTAALPGLALPPALGTAAAMDPTRHPTYATAALQEYAGQLLWSDLSYAQFDEDLPEMARRVGVYAQLAVRAANRSVLGVVRVGLATTTLDAIAAEASEGAARVALTDGEGRLLTRLTPADRVVETADENLRVATRLVDPVFAAALASPSLRAVDAAQPWAGEALIRDDMRCRVTAQYLANTQDWRVLVVVDEARLPGLDVLQRARTQALVWTVAVALLVAAAGLLALRALRRGLGRIVATAAAMRQMRFAKGRETAFFRDVEVALTALESAKTAGRAMQRYLPVDLVRRLFASNEEPTLGGELRDVTLLFTDVAGFTTFSETTPPDELAAMMGEYLAVLTDAVHAHQGIVDKFIGDAVMAIWNAPTPCADHPQAACTAVLAAEAALRQLYASPAWRGRPPWRTRFGLHRAQVMVGHFGAPDRLSYTALGDGVNLAARLEGLNKVYGTTVIASEAVATATVDLAWRRLDRVAVVGRSEGVAVYELRGLAATADDGLTAAYEAALALYEAREFGAAAEAFLGLAPDKAAGVLAERARTYDAAPPPASWSGIFVAQDK